MFDEIDWQVGDRAFAPWDSPWLYPGTLLYVDKDEDAGDVAFIKFDDGDRAVIPLSELKSVAIRPGRLVFCKPEPDDRRYLPAIVLGLRDDGLRVRFTEDDAEAMVSIRDSRLLNISSETE